MLYALCLFIILCLSLLCLKFHQQYRRNQQALHYITEHLHMITTTDSGQSVRYLTDNPALQALLVEINHNLAHNRHNQSQYIRTRLSMQKMLSNISHDLKTPLTVVKGYSELLLLDDPHDARLIKMNQRIDDVWQLILQFFDLAKLEAGDVDYPLSPVDVAECCRQAVIRFSDLLDSRHFTVDLQIPDTSCYVIGNIDAIHRILNNLIANAIHHGGDGNYLGIHLEPKDTTSTIHIIDHGKGIPHSYQEQIFNRLYTLDDARSPSYDNSGLGLTITKGLVNLMGGDIQMTSLPNRSTDFFFNLRNT